MIHALLDGGGYAIVRSIAFLIRRLSLESALAWGRGFGTLASYFDKRRKVAYVNLKSAFPESQVRERKRWTQAMFRHLGMTGVEIMRFPILREEEASRFVTHHGYENYLAHRKSGKGVILLTAHMGNW